jgi:hypothetical protein
MKVKIARPSCTNSRIAEKPPQTLLLFFQTTYDDAAPLANWDRPALE